MKFKISILFLLLSISLKLYSNEPFKITHGPYLCDMTQEAVTIIWTTNKPALSWVELAPDDNKNFYAETRPKFYDVEHGRKQAHKTLHKVRLKGLEAATKYRYRIYSKEVSEWKNDDRVIYGRTIASSVYGKTETHFTTFRKQADNISFIMLNDIHGRSEFMKDLCKNINFQSFDFVMQNGDMANSIESEAQIFDDFIDASVDLFASKIPLMYCRGNHETRGKYADFLSSYLPTENNQFYQFYTIGNTAFLILDGGEDKPDTDIEYSEIADFDQYRIEQAEWLKKVIESNEFKQASNRVVFLHIPPMVSTWHGAMHLMEVFVPILNKAKIDIMFSGHTHSYAFHPSSNRVNFPTLINSNNTYIKCNITAKGIVAEVIDVDGKVLHRHELSEK